MVRLAKRLAVLAVAGTLTATSLTGCGTINTDETVATVGDEKITLGVANFYARLQQAQYETYYASMMGTTAEEMWAKEASDDQTYEEQTKKSILENLENMYLVSQHASDYDVALTEEEQQAIKDAAAKFGEDNSDDVKKVVSQGTKGVLKLRGAFGCVRRTTITPRQTSEKANNVPILVISPAILAGTTPAKSPITVIKSALLRTGVWKRL